MGRYRGWRLLPFDAQEGQAMVNLQKKLGLGTLVVIGVTFALFTIALFTKGFTHDVLLEAAVFLVSVKLIIMTYRNSVGVEAIQGKFDLILSEEKHLEAVLGTLHHKSARDPGPAETAGRRS
jgi:hypothetical protein